jgi:putative oxidoreductase
MRTTSQAQSWRPRLLGLHAQWFRLCRAVIWPLVDLGVRITLAQAFFVSGVLKVTNWPAALYLAEHEYRVRWMDPVSAAYTGAAIELLCPVLLASGLLTRYAAVAMLILILVVQFTYNPVDRQLYSAALLAWYAIHGAGSLSLDRLLRPGLRDSALPFAPGIVRASQWLRVQCSPLYLTLLRLWVAVCLLLAGLHVQSWRGVTIQRLWFLLPLQTALIWPALLSVIAGGLLLLGLATRYVALMLMVAAAAAAMVHSPFSEDIYLLATLALLVLHGGGRASVDALWGAWARRRFASNGPCALSPQDENA